MPRTMLKTRVENTRGCDVPKTKKERSDGYEIRTKDEYHPVMDSVLSPAAGVSSETMALAKKLFTERSHIPFSTDIADCCKKMRRLFRRCLEDAKATLP